MLLLLLACQPPADDTAGETDAPTELTPVDVVAELTDVPTVVRVSWSTEAPSTGYVAFGPDTTYPHTSPSTAEGTEHSVLLLGNPGETDVHFRVFAEDATGALEVTDDATVRTGAIPGSLPSLARTGDPDPYGGVISLPIAGQEYAATFVDTDGNIVWFHLEERGYVVQRVRLATDGASVLYNAVWLTDLSGAGEIVRVSLDGAQVSAVPAPYTTHDFVELPDGTLCAIYTDVREVEGQTIYGDALLEIAPDGTSRTVWSAFDRYDPLTETSLNDSDATWTHFNVVQYDPRDDTYVVSIRNFNSLVKVDRQGTVKWTLGGWKDDFTTVGDTERHTGQHGFRLTEGELLLFDNGVPEEASSRAVRYRIDEEAHTLEQLWEHHHADPLYVWAMGDVHTRSDGGVRVTWSTSAVLEQLDPDGATAWELSADFGYIFGYTVGYPSMYGG